jgi:hypothetical protein
MAQITLNSTGVASNGTLALQTNGTTPAITIDASQNVGIGTGSPTSLLTVNGESSLGSVLFKQNVSAYTTGFSNPVIARASGFTGVYASGSLLLQARSDAATDIAFITGTTPAERMRIDSIGNVGIGVTPSAWTIKAFQINAHSISAGSTDVYFTNNGFFDGAWKYVSSAFASQYYQLSGQHVWRTAPSGTAGNAITFTQAMTLTAAGDLLVGKTASSGADVGSELLNNGRIISIVGTGATDGMRVNRQDDDGTLVSFRQAGTQEGSIAVSGTTVSYNGGHLSRWAQTTTAKDESLVKGTVLSNLDEMNVYTDADGNPVQNEQLNKVKVSDVEGDANVAGVFVNWDHDEDHNVDEINMAMTGDMIIRIAQGVTVQRGDLLMSAGDGTAKPQGDDIVRSKTIAKVTSTHVTCTYADGSYCVPCVLMAC